MKRFRHRLQLAVVVLMLMSMIGNVAPAFAAQDVPPATDSSSDTQSDTPGVNNEEPPVVTPETPATTPETPVVTPETPTEVPPKTQNRPMTVITTSGIGFTIQKSVSPETVVQNTDITCTITRSCSASPARPSASRSRFSIRFPES